MKKSLGKIVLILIFLQTLLLANQLATYKLYSDKSTAMIKEPIVITFHAKQIDLTDNMFFLFTPVTNPDYKIQLLNSHNENKQHHNAEVSFTYLLFPLKAKIINVKFHFTIQTSSDAALVQSYVDDHDGGKAIQKKDHPISLQTLSINVLKAPNNIDFYGDFTLKARSDKKNLMKYEDLNLQYTLEGEGYKNDRLSLLNEIPNVTLFKDTHDEYSKLTHKGYMTKTIYTYALSATEDFNIPALHFRAYSFTKHKTYMLNTPQYTIRVKTLNSNTLLDKTDSPLVEHLLSFKTIKEYLIYSIIFLFGFLSAKLTTINFKNNTKEKEFVDIKKTHTAHALILLLMNTYKDREIKKFIEDLEKSTYKESSQSFNKIKKEILKVFSK